MVYKNKKSRSAIPGYTLIPDGDCHRIRKISMTKERVKTDPAYHITRLHAAEFAEVARFGKVIRTALLSGTGIKNKAAPMTAVLFRALHADEETPLGMRTFDKVDGRQLIGFECNPEAPLSGACSLDIGIELVPVEGLTIVHIPPFMPEKVFTAPEGITHARMVVTTVVINTAEYTFEKMVYRSNMLPLKMISRKAESTVGSWSSGSNDLVIVALGIKWYQAGKTENRIIASPLAGPLRIMDVRRTMA